MSSLHNKKQNIQQKNQSISQNSSENNNIDDDFDDYDVNILKMTKLYTNKHTNQLFLHQRDSILSAQEIFKKIFVNAIKQAEENSLNRKVPLFSIQKSIAIVENQLGITIAKPDIKEHDYDNDGLLEDLEPNQLHPDTWLRARVTINTVYKDEENEQISGLPMSKPQDAQSKRISSKASSIGGGYYKKIQESESKNNLVPAPIDLTEPLNFSLTEERLRKNKENQKREKEEKIRKEQLQREAMILEEQQKYNKFQKENKAAGFTYDYNGDLLPVKKVKLNKLPPHAYSIEYTFKEEQKPIKDQKKKKKTTNPNGNNLPDIQKQKKVPETEKEFVKIQTNPPPILDNIGLSTGVTLTFDGRQRIGPRPNTVDMQTLTSGIKNIRMGKSQYEELIKNGGFNRGLKNDQEKNTQINKDEQLNTLNINNNVFLNTQKQMGSIEGKDSKKGTIKINSAKIYETLTQKVDDSSDENNQPNIKSLKQQQQKEKSTKVSPVDEFNFQIQKQQEWGKIHYGISSGNSLKKQVMRPTEKDLITIIGVNKYKPRERLIYTPFIPPTFDLRSSTSEGFFRRNLLTSEAQRNSQKTSEGIRNVPKNQDGI